MDYSGIRKLIYSIYGTETGAGAFSNIIAMLEGEASGIKIPLWYDIGVDNRSGLPLDEKDSVLITYGDQFRPGSVEREGLTPLAALGRFVDRYIGDAVSAVHILPFSPYSSDDGFSVIDYREVNPEWGSWDDIEEIGRKHKLMADLVLNHCSAKSNWFKKYLEWDSRYRDYFITVKPGTDVSMVFRPRALPLLTRFDTSDGEKLVWTTFSADQVDLNYANPEVLSEMLSIFMFYVSRGISIVRLDAIAYLWKEEGHSCLHHEKTHLVVKLFREVARVFAPWVVIITETNVPHGENLSYFGNGNDEAHMVYQFALPPLTLDAFIRQDARHLREWTSGSLARPSGNVTFFNFLASHDGIGVLPAKGILDSDEIGSMLKEVENRGGLISWKATADGKIPYEMNINYRSAIAGDEKPGKSAVDKFMASQAIMLAMEGVPGIYIHSITGSLNYREGVEKTGMNRSINREKFILEDIERELLDEASDRYQVLSQYRKLLDVRKREKAFHPGSRQLVLESNGPLLAFLRIPEDSTGTVLCLYNISREILKSFPGWGIFADYSTERFVDMVNGRESFALILSAGSPMVTLEPWQFVWLKLQQ